MNSLVTCSLKQRLKMKSLAKGMTSKRRNRQEVKGTNRDDGDGDDGEAARDAMKSLGAPGPLKSPSKPRHPNLTRKDLLRPKSRKSLRQKKPRNVPDAVAVDEDVDRVSSLAC